MRHLVASILSALVAVSLTACGAAEPDSSDALDVASSADLNGECHGLKSAHCFCKLSGGESMTTGSADSIIPAHVEGQDLFTYVIPGKCYNQVADLANSHFDHGCWSDCRDAFGVEGHPRDADVATLETQESQRLRASGACGGWLSSPLFFSAGTNKWRPATAAGIGIGIGGTVVEQNGQKVCK